MATARCLPPPGHDSGSGLHHDPAVEDNEIVKMSFAEVVEQVRQLECLVVSLVSEVSLLHRLRRKDRRKLRALHLASLSSRPRRSTQVEDKDNNYTAHLPPSDASFFAFDTAPWPLSREATHDQLPPTSSSGHVWPSGGNADGWPSALPQLSTPPEASPLVPEEGDEDEGDDEFDDRQQAEEEITDEEEIEKTTKRTAEEEERMEEETESEQVSTSSAPEPVQPIAIPGAPGRTSAVDGSGREAQLENGPETEAAREERQKASPEKRRQSKAATAHIDETGREEAMQCREDEGQVHDDDESDPLLSWRVRAKPTPARGPVGPTKRAPRSSGKDDDKNTKKNRQRKPVEDEDEEEKEVVGNENEEGEEEKEVEVYGLHPASEGSPKRPPGSDAPLAERHKRSQSGRRRRTEAHADTKSVLSHKGIAAAEAVKGKGKGKGVREGPWLTYTQAGVVVKGALRLSWCPVQSPCPYCANFIEGLMQGKKHGSLKRACAERPPKRATSLPAATHLGGEGDNEEEEEKEAESGDVGASKKRRRKSARASPARRKRKRRDDEEEDGEEEALSSS